MLVFEKVFEKSRYWILVNPAILTIFMSIPRTRATWQCIPLLYGTPSYAFCGRQFSGTEMKCHLENYTFKYRKIHKIISSLNFFNLEILCLSSKEKIGPKLHEKCCMCVLLKDVFAFYKEWHLGVQITHFDKCS